MTLYEQIIQYIGETAMKHIAVNTFKYQSRALINAQGNNRMMEVVIEDNSDAQYYKTANVFALNLNIDILGKPNKENSILYIQSLAFQIANEIIAYIGRDLTYMGYLSVLDKDFLFLSHYTDDDSAGVRLSLQLAIPDPVNLCTFDDNFDDDQMGVEVTDDVDLNPDIPTESDDELVLRPVQLPKNKK